MHNTYIVLTRISSTCQLHTQSTVPHNLKDYVATLNYFTSVPNIFLPQISIHSVENQETLAVKVTKSTTVLFAFICYSISMITFVLWDIEYAQLYVMLAFQFLFVSF